MRIAVVGAGSWGTTLADLLVREGHQVRVWAREPEVVESINARHVNDLFLPDAPLAQTLSASGDVKEVVRAAELLLLAAPSHAMRDVSEMVACALNGAAPLVISVAKGLEVGSLMPMTEVLEQTLPGRRTVALSGPSFADEVYRRCPTALVAAARDQSDAERAQLVMSSAYLRVYTSTDPYGVQLGGALKNVIAIASGILDGLGLGNNARAALITRGLAEMTRLGRLLGCDPMTFAGLAGMGDLIVTTTGAQSRNRTLGQELAAGRRLDEILAGRRTVAEGVRTTQAAVSLGRQHGVELPIAQEVEKVLFEGKEPRQAVRDLMDRELKPEHWT